MYVIWIQEQKYTQRMFSKERISCCHAVHSYSVNTTHAVMSYCHTATHGTHRWDMTTTVSQPMHQ